jgi:hypothetical protein
VKTKDVPNSSKEPGRRYGDAVQAPRDILFRSPQHGRTLSKKGWFRQGIWIVEM